MNGIGTRVSAICRRKSVCICLCHCTMEEKSSCIFPKKTELSHLNAPTCSSVEKCMILSYRAPSIRTYVVPACKRGRGRKANKRAIDREMRGRRTGLHHAPIPTPWANDALPLQTLEKSAHTCICLLWSHTCMRMLARSRSFPLSLPQAQPHCEHIHTSCPGRARSLAPLLPSHRRHRRWRS